MTGRCGNDSFRASYPNRKTLSSIHPEISIRDRNINISVESPFYEIVPARKAFVPKYAGVTPGERVTSALEATSEYVNGKCASGKKSTCTYIVPFIIARNVQ